MIFTSLHYIKIQRETNNNVIFFFILNEEEECVFTDVSNKGEKISESEEPN